MNASALLKSQGWRGHGHTLHTTDDSTGLAKPLLISRKDNKLGIGQKKHGGSDQWWLSALDEQLKGLDTSQQGVVVQTVTSGRLNAAVASGAGKYRGAGSLYASFVRGGMLEGTIRSDESTDATTTPEAEEERPAAPPPQQPPVETKEERRARREARRLRKAERAARRAVETTHEVERARRIKSPVAETEEERRARKEAKRRKREEKRRRAAADG